MTVSIDSVRGIIFDVDDTLVDTRSAWSYAVSCICQRVARLCPEVREDYIRTAYETVSDALWGDYNRALASLGSVTAIRSYVWKESLAMCNIDVSDEVLEELVTDFDAAQLAAYAPDPGLIELLGRLGGCFRLAVCSNGDGTQTRRKLECVGLLDCFEVIVCGIDEQVRKPDPELFRRCVSALGLPAQSCLYVGDDWRNDVLGSMDAGLRPVWIGLHREMPPDSSTVVSYATVTACLLDLYELSQRPC